MEQMIADSSALILLAKCGLLELVCKRFKLFVPLAVVDEVASAKLVRAYPDAALISELITKGVITVQTPSVAEFTVPISLHQGEKQALMLAKELERSVLATDDGKAIKASKFLNVPFIISPKIVTELFRVGGISLHEARRALEKLAKIGRYSPEIIADALVSLMEKTDGKADDHKDT